MLTIGSCCSGIGGLEKGLEDAGLGPVLYQIELDPFCQHVLRKHWPHAELHGDIRTVDASRLPRVDLVAAGTPCQNLSSAGDRSGLHGTKSRLFYEFLRVVRETRPAWVCFENVASGASRWVDTVRSHLEQLGYATLPIQVAASDLGAPHIRSRVFIVANCRRIERLVQSRRGGGAGGAADKAVALGHGATRSDAHADHQPGPLQSTTRKSLRGPASDALLTGREGPGPGGKNEEREGLAAESWWASEPDLVPVVHGLSGGLAGRYRRAALRAIGNSCSPAQAQVAGQVIRLLLEAEAAA